MGEVRQKWKFCWKLQFRTEQQVQGVMLGKWLAKRSALELDNRGTETCGDAATGGQTGTIDIDGHSTQMLTGKVRNTLSDGEGTCDARAR